MLSHSNLSWTASTACEVFQAQAGDCSVAFLPLSHIAEQMFTIHIPPVSGHQVLFFVLFAFVLFRSFRSLLTQKWVDARSTSTRA
jgi:long-subunit acyl-CoA synthetase (AMP-forming)